MAQQDTTCAGKELASKKQRPSSSKLQSSLSQPAPSNPIAQQKPTTRRHLTLPIPLDNNYPQSPAELYILSRSQMLPKPNGSEDISPSTPSSIASTTFNSPLPSPMGHAELMQNWYRKKENEICKKHKHRYMYGPPPPQASSGFPLTSPSNPFKK